MFEIETVGPWLVWKLKWGAMVPLAPTVATPLYKQEEIFVEEVSRIFNITLKRI